MCSRERRGEEKNIQINKENNFEVFEEFFVQDEEGGGEEVRREGGGRARPGRSIGDR